MVGAMSEEQAQAATDSAVKGKAAVRLHLIQRLEAAGLVRPGRVSREAFEAGHRHLCERLGYMTVDNLQLLAETLIDAAKGRDWPTEAVIVLAARSIQEPPPAQSRAMTWLESVEGPKAVMRGDLVEVYRHIRRHNRPPLPWQMREIAEQARENARRLQIAEEWLVSPQGLRDDEAKWRAAYLADRRAAHELVERGNQKRAGGAE